MLNSEVTLPDEQSAANSYQMFLSVEPDGDVIDRAVGQFGAWLRFKGWDPALDANGFQQDADRDLLTLHHKSSDGREFRARLTEATSGGLWRTQLTVQVPTSGAPWIALQVANSEGRWTAVPRLATYLLDSLTTKDGSTVMSSETRIVGPGKVEDLLYEIGDHDRQGLFLVAGTGHDAIDFSRFAEQVGRWTRQVRGLAQVVVLTPEATDEVWRELGPDHGVRPWMLRTFYPDVDPAIRADGLRHKFLTTERLASEREQVIRQLLGRIARRHAALWTPPVQYVRADRVLRRLEDQRLVESISLLLPEPRQAKAEPVAAGMPVAEVPDTVEELLAGAEHAAVVEGAGSTAEADASASTDGPGQAVSPDELAAYVAALEMVKQTLGVPQVTPETMTQVAAQLRKADSIAQAIGQVRAQLEEREDHLIEAQDRAAYYSGLYEEAQLDERIAAEEAGKLADENRWLKARLAEAGSYEAAYGIVPEDARTKYPGDFGDLYQRLLELIDAGVIFTGDPDEMLALDEHDTFGKLVTVAWDAFLALTDYVRARKNEVCDTNVKQYLKETPQGYRSLPQKKYAEKETAFTMKAWGDLREFPVPLDVDPSGRKAMEAHFKLGRVGMVSPRMYYLDCWSTHGKVYVGYIGAHLRNTKTN